MSSRIMLLPRIRCQNCYSSRASSSCCQWQHAILWRSRKDLSHDSVSTMNQTQFVPRQSSWNCLSAWSVRPCSVTTHVVGLLVPFSNSYVTRTISSMCYVALCRFHPLRRSIHLSNLPVTATCGICCQRDTYSSCHWQCQTAGGACRFVPDCRGSELNTVASSHVAAVWRSGCFWSQ